MLKTKNQKTVGPVVLGVDPGYGLVGIGVIQKQDRNWKSLYHGCIKTDAKACFSARLLQISEELGNIIRQYKPEAAVVEKLYFNSNTTTAIDVAQARGVIMLTLLQNGVEVCELTPLQVKQFVSGYGRADKAQMKQMMKLLLGLDKLPSPDDAADALALAYCWESHSKFLKL
ncbi:MAG TPA: crossover junction endodeoxyribonuclease RuvC [bacterium]|nr:crossover junction endodeoxyribonuclease RuvC [bacterium]